MNMQVLDARRDVGGGCKVDVSRGQRIGRVASEWFSRPDDERFLSLGDLARSVRGRSERSRTRVVESALIHVEANRNDPERLALILPGADAPVTPTHWCFGQLASQVGAPAAYVCPEDELATEGDDSPVNAEGAEQSISPTVDAGLVPSCIVMNPPFSTALNVETRVADAAFRHLSSAVARLADGGRLVAITGANCAPDNKAWRDGFVRLQKRARVVFTATIAGSVFASHGTSVETRLTVIDKVPSDDPVQFPASPCEAPDLATLLRWLTDNLPPRQPIAASAIQPLSTPRRPTAITTAGSKPRLVPAPAPEPSGVPLKYELIDWQSPSDGKISDTLYEPYTLQSIRIAGAQSPAIVGLLIQLNRCSCSSQKAAGWLSDRS